MAGIKRTPADDAFSLCVRERANWICEKCDQIYPEGQLTGRCSSLDCSHHYGRGNWSVRFNPNNGESLCYGCHSHYGGTETRAKEVLGEGLFDLLTEKKNDTNLGKLYRKTKGKGDIAKHYREEFKRMRELRAQGVTGRIEFEEFY